MMYEESMLCKDVGDFGEGLTEGKTYDVIIQRTPEGPIFTFTDNMGQSKETMARLFSEYRTCEVCGKNITSGYCIGDGGAHYCEDNDNACLLTEMTMKEYKKLYKSGYAYRTEWV